MEATITPSGRGAAPRALRKSAVADATRQGLSRACRSILASQVEGFSRNHSATYVFHGFSSSQPPRPSADSRRIREVTPVFLRPSLLLTRFLSLQILCWETREILFLPSAILFFSSLHYFSQNMFTIQHSDAFCSHVAHCHFSILMINNLIKNDIKALFRQCHLALCLRKSR